MWAIVTTERPSSGVRPSVRPLTFHILINSSEATGPIWTKLWWNGPWMAPFQNCVRWSRLPTKMAAKWWQKLTWPLARWAKNELAPKYLSNLIVSANNKESYDTRISSSDNFLVPKPNTELYKSSFSFSGPKVWNSLPNEIKTSKTLTYY